jgi:hypothetical protein
MAYPEPKGNCHLDKQILRIMGFEILVGGDYEELYLPMCEDVQSGQ